MKVIALKQGYFGKLREPGDKFEVPDGSKASWFEPVDVVKQEAKPSSKSAKPADDPA